MHNLENWGMTAPARMLVMPMNNHIFDMIILLYAYLRTGNKDAKVRYTFIFHKISSSLQTNQGHANI